MIDCIIGSWDVIFEIFAHGRWDEGVILTIIRDMGNNLSTVDVVCVADFVTFLLMIFYFS